MTDKCCRLPRWSLRAAMAVFTIFGVGMSGIKCARDHAKRRHEALAKIVETGGFVQLDRRVRSSVIYSFIAGEKDVYPVKGIIVDRPDVSSNVLQCCLTFPECESLTFTGIDLRSVSIANLRQFGRLRELDFSRTRIANCELGAVKRLGGLEYVAIGGTQLSDSGITMLLGLPTLNYLDVSNTEVSDAGLAGVATASNLKSLKLSGCRISDYGLEYVSRSRSLTWLDLSGTDVTAAGVMRLSGMTNLRCLYVNKTHINEDDMVGLRVMLSAVDIRK